MPNSDDVQLLVDFGVFNQDGISRLASMIRTIQSLTGGSTKGVVSRAATASSGKRRGRPPKAATSNGASAPAAPSGKKARAPRGSFKPSKQELQDLRKTMTVKQIAAKYGVSMPTVNLKLAKLGLTKPRKAKKK